MTEDFKGGLIVGCILVSIAGVVVVGLKNNDAEQRYIDDCVEILVHEDRFRGHQTSGEERNGYADGCQFHYHNR